MGCFISTEKRRLRITKSNSYKLLVVRMQQARRRSRDPGADALLAPRGARSKMALPGSRWSVVPTCTRRRTPTRTARRVSTTACAGLAARRVAC